MTDIKKKIYIDGIPYEVSENEYKDYYKSKERSKYLRKIEKSFTTVSYEALSPGLSTEDIFAGLSANVEEQALKNLLVTQLVKSYDLLSDEEIFLIKQLFYENKSEREIAKMIGISHTAVGKRWDKLKDKLKKILKI